MTLNALILTAEVHQALDALRTLAAAHPVSMPDLVLRIKTPAGKRRHMKQMNTQSLHIPLHYYVTLSIETGHPAGPCRHMSMSSGRPGHAPIPQAVWMVCEALGFVGSLQDCNIWVEDLNGGPEKAVNVVQPIATINQEGTA